MSNANVIPKYVIDQLRMIPAKYRKTAIEKYEKYKLCKGAFGTNEDGVHFLPDNYDFNKCTSFCLGGMICFASEGKWTYRNHYKVTQGYFLNFASWNNQEQTTKADVVRALELSLE